MRRLHADTHLGPLGSYGQFVRRAPGAAYALVEVYPAATSEFPPPDGLTRSQPVVWWVNQAERPPWPSNILDSSSILAELDLSDESRRGVAQPIPRAAEGLVVTDGGGDSTTAIVRGVIIWFAEDGEPAQSLDDGEV